MSEKDLLEGVRKLIEDWENCNYPRALYAQVNFTDYPLNDAGNRQEYHWKGEWHHYERKCVND